MTPPPFIVTAALDEAAFDWFDGLRREHFPPERNLVPAHVTLFHKLPGEAEDQVLAALADVARRTPPLSVAVAGPWFIGRGVAYRLRTPELEAVRADLAQAFAAWLTPQDRAVWRPHITIQNKADPAVARALLERLQHEFEPFAFTVEGLHLWRYLGGPWSPVATLRFCG